MAPTTRCGALWAWVYGVKWIVSRAGAVAAPPCKMSRRVFQSAEPLPCPPKRSFGHACVHSSDSHVFRVCVGCVCFISPSIGITCFSRFCRVLGWPRCVLRRGVIERKCHAAGLRLRYFPRANSWCWSWERFLFCFFATSFRHVSCASPQVFLRGWKINVGGCSAELRCVLPLATRGSPEDVLVVCACV